jgi:SAM-dependent methyltransferase
MAEDNWNKTHLKAMPVRPPFGPSEDDAAFMLEMTAPSLSAAREPAVLVLGVTPRVVHLDWPDGANIAAVDSSPGMVAAFAPHPALPSKAICAPWQEMPLDGGAFNAVVGDGSFNSLPRLRDYKPAFKEVARILKPEGVLVLRFFVRPEPQEAPEQLVALARAGAFPSTAAFRLRFAMALTEADGSVGLSSLWDAFQRLAPDRDQLAQETGWPRGDIDRVDVDQDSRVRFTFPTLSQLASLAEPEFAVQHIERGTYTQAEHCPTVLFRPR